MGKTKIINMENEVVFVGTIPECAEYANLSASTVKNAKMSGHATKNGFYFVDSDNGYTQNFRKWFKVEWDKARYRILKNKGAINYEYERLHDWTK